MGEAWQGRVQFCQGDLGGQNQEKLLGKKGRVGYV